MSKDNEKTDKGGINTKKWTKWVFIIVLVLYLGYFSVMCWLFPGNLEKRGQFGDMFGALGALFSGLAFAGLIITIMQQREDLKNQRDEINLQREDLEAQTEALRLQKEEIAQTNEELKSQRKEMEEQNKTIMLQRFENTFFNMLNLQMNIFEKVRYQTTGNVVCGEEAIRHIFSRFRASITNLDVNNIYFGELDHYNRHLAQILKLIDQTDFLSKAEKYNYVGLLTSHMSYYELTMFFYYCVSPDGRKGAKELVEKYALFRDFGENTVFDPKHLLFFEEGAYILKE